MHSPQDTICPDIIAGIPNKTSGQSSTPHLNGPPMFSNTALSGMRFELSVLIWHESHNEPPIFNRNWIPIVRQKAHCTEYGTGEDTNSDADSNPTIKSKKSTVLSA